jgi:hypothetical protein
MEATFKWLGLEADRSLFTVEQLAFSSLSCMSVQSSRAKQPKFNVVTTSGN